MDDPIAESLNRTLESVERMHRQAEQAVQANAEAMKKRLEEDERNAKKAAEKAAAERKNISQAAICQNCRWWHNPEGKNGGDNICRYNHAGSWIKTNGMNRCGQFQRKDADRMPETCKTCRNWHEPFYHPGKENGGCRYCLPFPGKNVAKTDADDYCGQHKSENE